MTIREFKRQVIRSSTNELVTKLIQLNNEYQEALKLHIQNTSKEEKYLIKLQKKIRYTSILLHIKQQNQQP